MGNDLSVQAMTVLRDDHELFRRILTECRGVPEESERRELLGTFATRWSVHTQLEEQLLYPVVREIDPGMVTAAAASHDEVRQRLDGLLARIGDPAWPSLVDAARERVDDALDREERDVFGVATAVFGPEGLELLENRLDAIRGAMVR